LGEKAFSYCSSLTSINIPESITSIGDKTFSFCTSLASVYLPKALTSVGASAFDNCNSLKEINYGGTIEEWLLVNKGASWYFGKVNPTVICTDGSIAASESIPKEE
jgi:hypothetical protein